MISSLDEFFDLIFFLSKFEYIKFSFDKDTSIEISGKIFLKLLEDNIYTLFCVTIVSVICTLISIFLVGCTREERQVVILKIKQIISSTKKESN